MVEDKFEQSVNDQYPRIRWGCRRGMLELDVILIPFVENHFRNLTTEHQVMFANLLPEADPDLYAWLMGHESAPERHKAMIAMIKKQHAR